MGGAANAGDEDFPPARQVHEFRRWVTPSSPKGCVEPGHLVLVDGEAEVSEIYVCLGAAAEAGPVVADDRVRGAGPV